MNTLNQTKTMNISKATAENLITEHSKAIGKILPGVIFSKRLRVAIVGALVTAKKIKQFKPTPTMPTERDIQFHEAWSETIKYLKDRLENIKDK